MTIRLIVNADDYGHTPGISAGIRKAHVDGIVTTTTTMMNLPDAVPALHIAREETPRLGVGVHLVLTHGEPMRGAANVPTLVTRAGGFPDLPDLYPMAADMDAGELRDEWRAQIEAFLATGSTIDHIDSHHHAAYMFEKMMRVLFDLAAEYDAPIRHPFAGQVMWDAAGRETFRAFAEPMMNEGRVKYPAVMNSAFYDLGVSLESLLAIIDGLEDGTTTEIMTHPALMDDELMTATTYNDMRLTETALLTDPRVIERVRARGIELVTFRGAV